MDQGIACEGFTARAAYDGYAYGDTFYLVSAVVRDLSEAIAMADGIRKAIASDPARAHWQECTERAPRLVGSDWCGNPVSIVLSYTARSCES